MPECKRAQQNQISMRAENNVRRTIKGNLEGTVDEMKNNGGDVCDSESEWYECVGVFIRHLQYHLH